ncbi:hypothetical protein [Acidovorax sp. SUPP2539]|uniref:hypothetical protein n=1 Tax=Acidovorax sp. SUPP2539 TaxID=2920878 RepID=UPI0023DE440E|nr:hypothetical protein [Acidovorax sp. SUPP2539]GKS88985.1 hypothetical protein AVTE2539_06490 [Acidovorax sp. SUPP2539]
MALQAGAAKSRALAITTADAISFSSWQWIRILADPISMGVVWSASCTMSAPFSGIFLDKSMNAPTWLAGHFLHWASVLAGHKARNIG